MGTLTTLTPGMGLSLYVGGTEAVEWTRPLNPTSGALTVRPGWNLVTWAGPDGAAVEDAFEPLGEIVLETRGAGGGALTALTTGSAFWLQASEAKEWWQLNSPPVVIFSRTVPLGEREQLRRHFRALAATYLLAVRPDPCQFVWYRRNDDATSARDEATSIVTAVDSTTGIVIRLREPPAAGDCPR